MCKNEHVLIKIEKNGFSVMSPLREFSIDIEPEKMKFIEYCLKNNELKHIHDIIGAQWIQKQGLDYYCPECDRIYCDDHCDLEINFDEGFYDDTFMICQKGHKRCMDD